ncbi:MAG: hypothetical protein ACYDCL_13700 [Myxococcales bacterium]
MLIGISLLPVVVGSAACPSRRVDFKRTDVAAVRLPADVEATGRVKVRDAAGRSGTVSLAHLVDALQEGYSVSDQDYPDLPPQVRNGRVEVTSPEGKRGTVAMSEVEEAKSQGYSVQANPDNPEPLLDAWLRKNATPEQLRRIDRNMDELAGIKR